MKKRIHDKTNGLNYTLQGDYYFPELIIKEEEATYAQRWNCSYQRKNHGACVGY